MLIYVAAPSESGPCKIGVSLYPQKRIRSLQTGHPRPLSIFHEEPVLFDAKSIERSIHASLSDKKTGGGGEWFDVTTEEARAVVRGIAASSKALIHQTATLRV